MKDGVAEIVIAQGLNEVVGAMIPLFAKNGYQVGRIDRENGIIDAIEQHSGRRVNVVLFERNGRTSLTLSTSTSQAEQIRETHGGTSDQLATMLATRASANSSTANLAKLLVSHLGTSVA